VPSMPADRTKPTRTRPAKNFFACIATFPFST
jgi:hypothetical protein